MFWRLFKKKYSADASDIHAYLCKELQYQKDILSEEQLSDLKGAIEDFRQLQKSGSLQPEGQARFDELLKLHKKWIPPQNDRGWKENTEIIFVALVIALGVRAYFLQPFKIPTHSMYPTLYGILPEPRSGPLPDVFERAFDFIYLGKTYHRLETLQPGTLSSIHETYAYGIRFSFTRTTTFTIGGVDYTVWANLEDVLRIHPEYNEFLKTNRSLHFEKAQEIVNFSVTNGDHIFVNKMIYHFRKPRRGDVFVFTTKNINGIMKKKQESQHYIKRCVALGGDTVQVNPPYLYINGSIIQEPPIFQTIYSKQKGYHGYINAEPFLPAPQSSYQIPEDSYWAMGDNSPGSSDSREWGSVPEENVVGAGFIVYWPFSSRFGAIK